MPSFRFITAKDWGATWKRPPVKEKLLDPEGYLHHTAGNPHKNRRAEEALQILNIFAQETKDYSFLDYDYMVHWYAPEDLYTIAEGRGEWLSAATNQRNELGEALCVMGYFHPGHSLSELPNPGHIQACAMGFAKMIERGLLARDAEILGHFQNKAFPTSQTGCPGDYLIPFLPEIRELTKFFMAWPSIKPGGEMLHTFDPKKRILDTRVGGGSRIRRVSLPIKESGIVAKSAVVNVAVVDPAGPGYVRVFGQHEGEGSDLNFQQGEIRSNSTLVAVHNGEIIITSSVPTHLVVDLQGIVD